MAVRHPDDAGLGKRPGRHCRTMGGAAWSAWALLLPVDARERPRDGEGETEWGDVFLKRGGRGRVRSRVRTDTRVEVFPI